MVIRHNLAANNTNRQFNIVTRGVSSATEKLSSGYKINRAADDAAGLSISEKMRKQIRGLSQASLNAEDGISLVQTVDGALEEVHDILQRMNELCVKAANGTNSDSDRACIEDEVNQLKTEIDRIGETTTFNEKKIMVKSDSSVSVMPFEWQGKYKELVYDKNYTLDEIEAMDGVKLLYTDIYENVTTTQTGGGDILGLSPINSGYDNLRNTLKNSIVPQAVNGILETFDSTFGNLSGSSIGIGLCLYNDAGSNTLASVAISASTSNILTYQLSVNIASLDFDGSGNLTSTSRTNLENTIVHEMMHAFMDESLTNGMLGYDKTANNFVSSQAFPAWFKEGAAQAAAGAGYRYDFSNGTYSDWLVSAGVNQSSTDEQIKNELSTGSKSLAADSSTSRYATGYLATMYLAYLAAGGNGSVNPSSLAGGLDSILSAIEGNSTTPGKSLDEVIKEASGNKYNGISDFESKFATDSESIGFIKSLYGAIGSNGSGGLVVGFYDAGDLLSDSSLPGITLFQLDTANNSVQNKYPSTYKVFAGGTASKAGDAGFAGAAGSSFGAGGIGSAANVISLHIGADADMTNKLAVAINEISCSTLSLDSLSLNSVSSSTKAINRVNFAISCISSERSKLGAYQNRLEHTIKNLDNIVENTTAAESQIRDTDMAKTMVSYSNLNILLQAGQSMLSQANMSNKGVLSLLS